jgi:hypothetical protein
MGGKEPIMATKKNTAETDSVTREKELEEAIKKLKKEKEALLKEVEAMKAEAEEPEPVEEANDESDYWNERVPYEAFYDGDKYADDISVMVNGKRFLIKRGETVMIPRYVAQVLINAGKQAKYSADYNRRLQRQFENETRKYLGE